MEAFPQKSAADMLITRYFNTYDPAYRKLGTYQSEGK